MQLTKEEVKKTVGEKIRSIRLKKNLSIESLAIDADMDYTQLSRIELGKINTSIYQIYKLASALQVPLSNIINDIE
jgi:transcriptional regulator with XRE-family HTH domain